jgi:hypothetical protein
MTAPEVCRQSPGAFTKDLTATDTHTNAALGNYGKRKRREWTIEEHEASAAVGEGPVHEKLRDRYDSELRSHPSRSPAGNFSSAWIGLGRADQDEIRAEESGEAAARVAEDAARSRRTKGTSKMEKGEQVGGLLDAVASVYADSSLLKDERAYVLHELVDAYRAQTGRDALADIKAAVAAKASSNAQVTKASITNAVRHVADGCRQAGETVAQARARYWESAAGRSARAAFKRAPDEEAAPRAQPVVSPGLAAFHKAAAERAAKAGISIAAAKVAIAESRDARDRSIWTSARKGSRA